MACSSMAELEQRQSSMCRPIGRLAVLREGAPACTRTLLLSEPWSCARFNLNAKQARIVLSLPLYDLHLVTQREPDWQRGELRSKLVGGDRPALPRRVPHLTDEVYAIGIAPVTTSSSPAGESCRSRTA